MEEYIGNPGHTVSLANALIALEDHPAVLAVFVLLLIAAMFLFLLWKHPEIIPWMKFKRRKTDGEGLKAEGREISLSDALRRLDRQEGMIKKNALQSCIGIIYAPGVPIGCKLDAAVSYFKLHGNGNVKEYVAEMIAEEPNGRQHWQTALNRDAQECGPPEDKFFIDASGWIGEKTKKGIWKAWK